MGLIKKNAPLNWRLNNHKWLDCGHPTSALPIEPKCASLDFVHHAATRKGIQHDISNLPLDTQLILLIMLLRIRLLELLDPAQDAFLANLPLPRSHEVLP